jgi:hypothetical protein
MKFNPTASFSMSGPRQGSRFEFQFRLRYGMDAMTASSLLYDYYNPEANATVVPVRFVSH